MAVPLAAAAAVAEVVTGLAQLPAAIKGFSDSLTGFVAAVDPSTVRAVTESLRSLQATIGYSIVPALQGFGQLVREVAGELMAPMTDLRDTISELTSEGLAVLRPLVQGFGSVMRDVVDVVKSMMPSVRVLTMGLEGLSSVVGAVVRVTSALTGALLEGLFGSMGNMKEVIDAVRYAFVQLTVGVIYLTDTFLRAIGQVALANKILAGLVREPDKGRPGAMQDVRLGDVMSGYKARLIEAAKSGTGQTIQEQQKTVMEQVRDEVQAMRREAAERNGKDLDFMGWLRGVLGPGAGAVQQAGNEVSRWFNRQEGG